MRSIIRLGLISAVALFLILFGMSLLIPSKVRISRALNLPAGKAKILPLLRSPEEWKRWNTLYSDSIRVRLTGVSDSLLTSVWQYRGRELSSGFWLEESAGVTVVQWYFDFDLRWYPWEKFGSIVFDKQFGTPMETSLQQLGKLVENSP